MCPGLGCFVCLEPLRRSAGVSSPWCLPSAIFPCILENIVCWYPLRALFPNPATNNSIAPDPLLVTWIVMPAGNTSRALSLGQPLNTVLPPDPLLVTWIVMPVGNPSRALSLVQPLIAAPWLTPCYLDSDACWKSSKSSALCFSLLLSSSCSLSARLLSSAACTASFRSSVTSTRPRYFWTLPGKCFFC